MNTWWLGAAIGCILGFLSGLGVGGGSLLMLWLTGICGADPSLARILNLMFFIPCALSASFFRIRQIKPPKKLLLRAVIGGLLGALIGNWLRGQFDPELMRSALGILFLLCGVRELLFRPEN